MTDAFDDAFRVPVILCSYAAKGQVAEAKKFLEKHAEANLTELINRGGRQTLLDSYSQTTIKELLFILLLKKAILTS